MTEQFPYSIAKKLKTIIVCSIGLLLLLNHSLNAQSFNNKRQKIISLDRDTVQIDTLSISPESVIVLYNNKLLSSDYYAIDAAKSLLIWNRTKLTRNGIGNDSVSISYRVFPFLFFEKKFHKNIQKMEPDETGVRNPFTYSYDKKEDDFFQTEGLNKNGSISRGISFGNNQDVVVNSNLNLQLSGKINETITIKAAIADDNIPIQPQGNTQQLQEFDRVYIQLNDERSQLVAGDFILTRPKSYFLNYNKKAQGGSFSTVVDFKEGDKKNVANPTMKISTSAAVSKGKFSRNIIKGVEGNQGPYRLKGAENELFIIILSGSERIFMDGELLVRGQNNDYIIDYNTSEITFTPKRLVTKDKRIVAEFQYSDKNYARSLLQFTDEVQYNKLKLSFNIYSEQDNKNKPLLQELKDNQKTLLRSIGDSLNQAVSPNIDTVTFSANEVLYEIKDSVVDGIYYKGIYEYSTNSEKAIYRLGFSDVGALQGNYKQVNSNANGKVYQWFPPINGIKQGNFEPVLLLVTPKQKQMMTIAADYALSENTRSSIEIAYTKNDINTFSNKDSEDDGGVGIKYTIENKIRLSSAESEKKWAIKTQGNYEMVSSHFSPIERFRAVEFERDWNRASPIIDHEQHIAGGKITLEDSKTSLLSYQFNSLFEGSKYNGVLHGSQLSYTKNSIKATANGSLLNSTGKDYNSQFLRHRAMLSKTIKKAITIGVKEEQEQSRFIDNIADTLNSNSFDYWEWQGFVSNADTTANKYTLKYVNRTDWNASKNRFKKSTLGENFVFETELNKNSNSQFKTSVTYRKLAIIDTLITAQKADNSLIGRVEYDFKLWKNTIISNTYYEVGSGLEVKKEYSFLEVAAGQGFYTWKDYNENNVKELNEFEIAVFKDQANYIKIYTPTNEFVKTYNNQFNQLINISFYNLWNNKTGIRKFVSRLSDQATYTINRKTNNNDLTEAYNPFLNAVNDSLLATLNSSLRNTFYFNRFGEIFGFELNYQDQENKSLLVNGYESRSNIAKSIRTRWNITRKFLLNAEAIQGEKINSSQFFSTRDYNIIYYTIEPKLTFQPNTVFRVSLAYSQNTKENFTGEIGAKAILQKVSSEVKYNVVSKGSLLGKVSYILIEYNGNENSPLAFEMLEGLKIGQNILWSLSYQRNLSNNMQVSINYDGRKPESSKTIHTGGIQVRAFF